MKLCEWVGASCVCTAANTPSPLSSVPVSGELSPCRVNNGGCQDLCLLTHQGHVNCSCRGGRILQEDLTCRGERGDEGGGHWWGTLGTYWRHLHPDSQKLDPPKPFTKEGLRMTSVPGADG